VPAEIPFNIAHATHPSARCKAFSGIIESDVIPVRAITLRRSDGRFTAGTGEFIGAAILIKMRRGVMRDFSLFHREDFERSRVG